MAKSGKGLSFSAILLGIGIVVQLATIVFILIFIQQSKEAHRLQEVVKAKESAEWRVPMELLPESEQKTTLQYLTDSSLSIRSYWHSEDSDFRLTVKTGAIRELMGKRILMVKEGVVGKHLVLTLYYNPLKLKDPTVEDLTVLYQIVRYEKPELAKLYAKQEEERLQAELQASQCGPVEEETEEEVTNTSKPNQKPSTQETEEEVEKKEEPAQKPLIEKDDLHYPFEESQILKETDDYIIYLETPFMSAEDLSLNRQFIDDYLTEDSFRGDYGWEKALFYWQTEESVEKVEEEDTETETK